MAEKKDFFQSRRLYRIQGKGQRPPGVSYGCGAKLAERVRPDRPDDPHDRHDRFRPKSRQNRFFR
jgi:hypothetical protein